MNSNFVERKNATMTYLTNYLKCQAYQLPSQVEIAKFYATFRFQLELLVFRKGCEYFIAWYSKMYVFQDNL